MYTIQIKKTAIIKRIAMLLLAIFPILNYYQGPVFSYGVWSFLLLIVFSIVKTKSFKNFIYTKSYFYYWGYLTIAAFITCIAIKVTMLIPGGVSFFVWSLILGFAVFNFEFRTFRRNYEIIFLVTASILATQEFLFFTTGHRFIAFIPLSENLTLGIPYSELLPKLINGERSSSLFSEPAHFAQFALPLLAIELFIEENRKILFPKSAIIVVLGLILSRSGNGFLGIILLYIIKIIDYYKSAGGKKTVLLMLIAIPLVFYGFTQYSSTQQGADVLERTEELANDDASGSYIRIYRGYYVYGGLPIKNQIFGVTLDELRSMNIPLLHLTGDDLYDMYFNGVQSVLIFNGLLGLIFLVFFFVHLYKNGNMIARSNILLFLLLSLIGQMYLSYTMLFCTVLAMNQQKTFKNI